MTEMGNYRCPLFFYVCGTGVVWRRHLPGQLLNNVLECSRGVLLFTVASRIFLASSTVTPALEL